VNGRISETVFQLIRNPETPQEAIRDAVIEEGEAVASVFVVTGETGEYSDTSSWNVAAFLDKAQAEAFCESLNQWCRDHGVLMSLRITVTWEERYSLKNPLDPDFSCDYTGTQYHCFETPLRAEG
jgi:hypothetical protein